MSLVHTLCLLVMAGRVFMAALPENKVEVFFVVDQAVVSRYMADFGEEATAMEHLEADVNYFISEINNIFNRVEGLSIGIEKRALRILTEDILQGPDVERDAGLKTFDAWRKDQTTYPELMHDVAVLWTGYELVRNGDPATAGFANVGKVCDAETSSLIAEFDRTCNTVLVTAHEIGHVLGSGHDSDTLRRVMGSEASPSSSNRWTFSSASVASMRETISGLSKNCLLETSPESIFVEGTAPSDLMDPDTICKRAVNNKDSYMIKMKEYYEMQPPHGDQVCRAILCYDGQPDLASVAYASDHMICGKNKRCSQGLCVDSPDEESGAVSDNCVFRDQKSIHMKQFTGTCADLVEQFGPSVCYYYQSMCCQTCAQHSTGDPDCEFGDRSAKCKDKEQWSVCPKSSATCCGLCKGFEGKRSADDGPSEVILPDTPPASKVMKAEVVAHMDD